MLNKFIGSFAVAIALVVPGAAMAAASAVVTADVNLRAGPSTQYPVVNVIGEGHDVRVYGCLSSRSWCDVSYGGQRGWMSSNYLAVLDNGRRYTGSRIVPSIGAPVISFSFGSYWDNHYRGRAFYRDRDRWDHRDRWDRDDRDRWDRNDRSDRDRWDRRDDRRDVKDARKELRQERRDVKDARKELRQERRAGGDVRDARRELRKERAERREAKRELRRERRD